MGREPPPSLEVDATVALATDATERHGEMIAQDADGALFEGDTFKDCRDGPPLDCHFEKYRSSGSFVQDNGKGVDGGRGVRDG